MLLKIESDALICLLKVPHDDKDQLVEDLSYVNDNSSPPNSVANLVIGLWDMGYDLIDKADSTKFTDVLLVPEYDENNDVVSLKYAFIDEHEKFYTLGEQEHCVAPCQADAVNSHLVGHVLKFTYHGGNHPGDVRLVNCQDATDTHIGGEDLEDNGTYKSFLTSKISGSVEILK